MLPADLESKMAGAAGDYCDLPMVGAPCIHMWLHFWCLWADSSGADTVLIHNMSYTLAGSTAASHCSGAYLAIEAEGVDTGS